MTGMLLAAAADPSTFDWWTGVWIPIVVGIISILLAGAALMVARAANKTAQAALELSREIAEKEREERKQERDREVIEARERVAQEASDAYYPPGPADAPASVYDARVRVPKLVEAIRRGCLREGLSTDVEYEMFHWLLQITEEVDVNIQKEGMTDPTGKRLWRDHGWSALDWAVAWQLDTWRRTGRIKPDLKAQPRIERNLPKYAELLEELGAGSTEDADGSMRERSV